MVADNPRIPIPPPLEEYQRRCAQNKINALRKEVKHKMVDLDLDGRKANLPRLAADLSNRTGKKISRETLSMALTGFRSTAGYQTILQELHAMLTERINIPA